jgi:hypothetical protein
MTKVKRKPTSYAILMAEKPQQKAVRMVGNVEAFTPDQAKVRALALASVEKEAARNGRVTLYAVPKRSMTSTTLKTRTASAGKSSDG